MQSVLIDCSNPTSRQERPCPIYQKISIPTFTCECAMEPSAALCKVLQLLKHSDALILSSAWKCTQLVKLEPPEVLNRFSLKGTEKRENKRIEYFLRAAGVAGGELDVLFQSACRRWKVLLPLTQEKSISAIHKRSRLELEITNNDHSSKVCYYLGFFPNSKLCI